MAATKPFSTGLIQPTTKTTGTALVFPCKASAAIGVTAISTSADKAMASIAASAGVFPLPMMETTLISRLRPSTQPASFIAAVNASRFRRNMGSVDGKGTNTPTRRRRSCAQTASGQIAPLPNRPAPPDKGDELAPLHSITSSARSKIDVGTSMPSALAVLRLTAVSNFVGCSTGNSAGLSPLSTRPV